MGQLTGTPKPNPNDFQYYNEISGTNTISFDDYQAALSKWRLDNPVTDPIQTPTPEVQKPAGELSHAYGLNIEPNELKNANSGVRGSQSLMNGYSLFNYWSTDGDSSALYDRLGEYGIHADSPDWKNPSFKKLIDPQYWRNTPAKQPYYISDFIYLKDYGLIPNNRLVTLRRFPAPVTDSLEFPTGTEVPAIAQAVTYFGEHSGNKLNDIIGFGAGLKWKALNSEVQDVQGNEKGFKDGPAGLIPGKLGSGLNTLNEFARGTTDKTSGRAQEEMKFDPYKDDGPYWNRVFGPVNVVTGTFARDRGLEFKKEQIVLQFNYSLQSYGEINPKIALLDIMANLLAIAYNNGKFWGGATRYFPNLEASPFFGDQNAFYEGRYEDYFKSASKQLGDFFGGAESILSDILANPLEALKGLGAGAMNMGLAKHAKQSQPEILSIKSLLTGAPVGEWHIVVGNPFHPIAMIGNLVCDDIIIEFGETLGQDEFPTELIAKISLKHGRDRDSGDIQSMFNAGRGRLYYGRPGTNIDASASTKNSIVTKADERDAQNNNKTGGKKKDDTFVNTSPKEADAQIDTTKKSWGHTQQFAANVYDQFAKVGTKM